MSITADRRAVYERLHAERVEIITRYVPRFLAETIALALEPFHGTRGGYTNHGCRCDPCREAHSLGVYEDRKRRGRVIAPDDPRHGKSTTYSNHGCRCDRCREAATRADRERRQRRKAAK